MLATISNMVHDISVSLLFTKLPTCLCNSLSLYISLGFFAFCVLIPRRGKQTWFCGGFVFWFLCPKDSMATTTAPMMKVKSHQLHNFPVSLKWGQATTIASAATPVAADSETESEPERRTRSRSARNHRFSFTLLKNSPPKVPVFEPDSEREHRQQEQQSAEKEESNNFRPWKLRPRKEALVVVNPEQQREKEKEKESQFQQPKSARLRGMVEGSSNGGGGEREEGCVEKKRKFWIALSREEIEEDVFIMTGSRPARRPKKRPKNVQKLLDNVFPGLWLVGATVDSYRVAESPVKG